MRIIFLVLLVILILLYFMKESDVEHFENNFDKIYSKIYDIVFDEKELYKNQIDIINKKYMSKVKNPTILDAGCGVGRHYQYIKYPTIGIDLSDSLLKHARIRNPSGKFVRGNLVNDNNFKPGQFSYILCLMDSLYYNDSTEKDKILSNFYYWLKPDGILCIDIYDRSKLDPGAREYTQYYKDKLGNKHGLTYFNTFTHDGYWKSIDDENIKYIETIVLEDGRKKTKETKLYMPKDKTKIISKINKYGFKLIDIINVKGMEDSEIYIFKKIKYEEKMIKI